MNTIAEKTADKAFFDYKRTRNVIKNAALDVLVKAVRSYSQS